MGWLRVKAVWSSSWSIWIWSTDFIRIFPGGTSEHENINSLLIQVDPTWIEGSLGVEFVSFPTFHCLELADHKLVLVSLHLGDRPSLVSYWKFNSFVLERLEKLSQRALEGVLIGNKWWRFLKPRIRVVIIKYCQKRGFHNAKRETSIEDRLPRAVDRGDTWEVRVARNKHPVPMLYGSGASEWEAFGVFRHWMVGSAELPTVSLFYFFALEPLLWRFRVGWVKPWTRVTDRTRSI